MLIDITLKGPPSDELIARATAALAPFGIEYQWDKYNPQRIQQGVYWGGSYPEGRIEEELFDFYNSAGNLLHTRGDTRDPIDVMREDGLVSNYGVCDGIVNLLTHREYALILGGPRRFTVFLTEISRAEHGDWRWHKWGPYIGTYVPRFEHLRDEAIDGVVIFKILEHV